MILIKNLEQEEAIECPVERNVLGFCPFSSFSVSEVLDGEEHKNERRKRKASKSEGRLTASSFTGEKAAKNISLAHTPLGYLMIHSCKRGDGCGGTR
jgi:hypothetical protein